MGEIPEDHEILDDFIGDCAAYSLGGTIDFTEMEADIDGEWVKASEVRENVLRGIAKYKLREADQ